MKSLFKKTVFKNWTQITLFFILILGLFLRLNKFANFPIYGESKDEIAWTMLGSSLIQKKYPISWSEFPAYKNDYVLADHSIDINHPVVSPVFDHPPLFSFLPGIAQTIKGDWQGPYSAKVIRFPIILLGVVNIYLLFLLSKKIFKDTRFALLATAIYSTAPLFVFSHRLVVSENLLTTWLLLTLIFLYDRNSKKTFIKLVLLSCLAMLTKMAGVIIALLIITTGIIQKKSFWKAGLIGAFLGILLFCIYGAFYNWPLFTQVMLTQASRGLGFATFYNRIFIHPALVHKIYTDGWMITGLLSMALLIYSAKDRFIPIVFAFLANTIFILFFVSELTYYGWYEYPAFPLYCISLTYVVREIFKRKNYILIGVFWILLLPLHRFALINSNLYYDLSPFLMRGLMILGFLPWSLHVIKAPKRIIDISIILIFFLILLSNIVTVLTFTQETYWGTDEYLYFRGYIFP